jgi:hypothetical protein
MFLCPTCERFLVMPDHTSGELIMIFGLTEIFILNFVHVFLCKLVKQDQ